MKHELIYGLHSVQALLKSAPQRVQEIYLLQGRNDQRLQKIAHAAEVNGIRCQQVSRSKLDELVAGTLLHYPMYWDWELKGYTTCMAVLHRLLETRQRFESNGQLHKLRAGWWRRQWRKAKILAQAYL